MLHQRMPTLRINMVFSNEKFMAGDYLNAKILVDSSDPDTVIERLSGEVRGIGRTGWVNIHTDKIFEKEILYWSVIETLAIQSSLSNGRHSFPLQILIPNDCPSSYESQYGTVRYEIKIVLEANTEQASTSQVFPFLVISRSFLSQLPSNLLSPIDYRDEIDFTCCTLPFGTVSLKVHLKRTAFVIGESVEPIVEVKNGTRRQLKDTTVLLLSKSTYEARSRYEHVDEKKLAEFVVDRVDLGNVNGRRNEVFETCSLRIPFDAPPTQKGGDSSIISLHYVLRLTAIPGIEFEIPLYVASSHSDGRTVL